MQNPSKELTNELRKISEKEVVKLKQQMLIEANKSAAKNLLMSLRMTIAGNHVAYSSISRSVPRLGVAKK